MGSSHNSVAVTMTRLAECIERNGGSAAEASALRSRAAAITGANSTADRPRN